MNNPTDWIKEGVEAVVMIAREPDKAGDVLIRRSRSGDYSFWIPQSALRPLPPPLSPTAQRVAEAAMAEEQALTIFRAGGGGERGLPRLRAVWELTQSQTSAAVAEHLATLRPADPLAVAMEALGKITEERDAGRHDGLPEPCPEHDADTMFAIARAAIALIERAVQEWGR